MANFKSQASNLFLLGAGFTRAVFPDAPLNKDLLTVLCKGAKFIKLKEYGKEHKTKDIEIILTHLDLEIFQPKAKQQTALKKLRKTINQKLAECFGRFRFKEESLDKSTWLKEFVNLFQPNDGIISLNYDCLLEGVLDYYEVWSPADGYPGIGAPPLSFNLPLNSKNIHILKIHGSEHFIEAPDPMNNTKTAVGFLINESIYPRSGKHLNYDFGMNDIPKYNYVIAPSFVKTLHEHIERMMIEALKAASSVKNFIVIGCSLRPEDSHLWLLLTSFLDQHTNDRKLIIVDPCAEKIKSKICDHYFVDIDDFINIRLFSNGLELVIKQLINELHDNNA